MGVLKCLMRFFSPVETKKMLCVIDQNEIVEHRAQKIQSCSTHLEEEPKAQVLFI